MPVFGKKFPAPVAQPMAPFYIAGLVIMYGVNSFAGLLSNTMFKDDPRNPNAKTQTPADKRT